MDPQIAYQPPTGPDQVVEHGWLYERPDGATVPAPDEAIGNECGKVTALWDLFLVPVPEVPRGGPQDDDDTGIAFREALPGNFENGSHDCKIDNNDY